MGPSAGVARCPRRCAELTSYPARTPNPTQVDKRPADLHQLQLSFYETRRKQAWFGMQVRAR